MAEPSGFQVSSKRAVLTASKRAAEAIVGASILAGAVLVLGALWIAAAKWVFWIYVLVAVLDTIWVVVKVVLPSAHLLWGLLHEKARIEGISWLALGTVVRVFELVPIWLWALWLRGIVLRTP